MLIGQHVVLRATRREDLAALQPFLEDDVDVVAIASGRPWPGRPLEAAQARFDKELTGDPDPTTLWLVVADREDDRVIGGAGYWGIDQHHRSAHLGTTVARDVRGRGIGRDVCRVLADHAFRVRGLHRLQIDTLAVNTAARRAAEAAGFRLEGVLREAEWYDGRHVDGLVLGLLASDWYGSEAERLQTAARTAAGRASAAAADSVGGSV